MIKACPKCGTYMAGLTGSWHCPNCGYSCPHTEPSPPPPPPAPEILTCDLESVPGKCEICDRDCAVKDKESGNE